MKITSIKEIINYETIPEWIGQISKKNVECDEYQDMLMKQARFIITRYITNTTIVHDHITTYSAIPMTRHLTVDSIKKIGKELCSRFNKVWFRYEHYPSCKFLEQCDIPMNDYDFKKYGKPRYIVLCVFDE